MDELSGTKALIFDKFVEMTSTLGYENVSIRDIGKQVGINSASIYYHYENKGTILECAYEYYSEHEFDNRLPIEEMFALVETASPEAIVTKFFTTFESEDKLKYARMVLITKIVYMRLFQDPLANKIYGKSISNNTEYVTAVLNHGVEKGRIDPSFDIATFTSVLIGAMQSMGVRAFAASDFVVGQLDEEKKILALHAHLLSTALNY